MKFIDFFHELLQEKDAIPFVSFMQAALYTPNLGYYSSGLQVLGKEGDFITAPELTPLFGQTLANQCQPILTALEHPILLEFGAGTGRLCVDLLKQLQCLNALPDQYYILELSGHLKARQQALIENEIPELAARVHWLEQWPQKPFQGVILGNEVLDAMPVHRFLQTAEGILESYVTLDEQKQFNEIFKPCTDPRLLAHVQQVLSPALIPFLSEANLWIEDWMKQCFDILAKGEVLLIDYGFPRHEYYHPDRSQGTLMCHYRHHVHSNPFLHVGEQDITAHVDFTHVAEAADSVGFHVAGFTDQASFLINNGILDLMNAHPESVSKSAIKQLLQPSEMGELFKVIALTKQWDKPLKGFEFNDKRGRL